MPAERFRPDELAGSADLPPGGERPADQAGLLATARELEWLAAADDIGPAEGFEDRVMAAIAREPAPRPLAAATRAARRGRPLAILASLGDLWRVAWSGGRPLAVRAPAMAIVVLLLAGAVGLGGLGTAAALGLLGPREPAAPTPAPIVTPSPSPLPAATPSPPATASPTASPSRSPGSTATPSPSPISSPGESSEPAETPEAESPRPTETPEPTRTPRPTETPEP